jgi:hypothetical protein
MVARIAQLSGARREDGNTPVLRIKNVHVTGVVDC